jgi:anti-sigma factor (TIGR02949 family)
VTRIDRYTCAEAVRRLDDFLDRELSPEEMRLVRAHLGTCAFCAAEFGFEASLLAELRPKLARISAPAGLTERVFRALAAARRPPDTRV